MKIQTTNVSYSGFLKRITVLSMVMLATIGLSFGQLNGTYTIDQNSATAGTNFKDFAAFRNALNAGVSGPITVNVVAGSGPYTTTSFRLNTIAGASATNTITINGNGEKLTSTGTAYPYAVIELNGTDYITFNNLHVENTRSGSYYMKCFWLHNSADDVTIENCELSMPNTKSTYNASCYIGVMQSYSSVYSYGDPAEDLVIKNNKMHSARDAGPYSGVVVVHEASRNYNKHKTTIEKNDIRDWYYYGLWLNYASEMHILENEIHNTDGGAWGGYKYGIYHYAYYKDFGNSEMIGNHLHDLKNSTNTSYLYGIYVYGYYSRGISYNFVDNVIENKTHSSSMYGLYTYFYQSGVTKELICNNNTVDIRCQNTSTTYYTYNYGIYFMPYYTRQVDFVECSYNKVNIDAGAYSYGIYFNGYYCNGLQSDAYIKNNVINCMTDYYSYGLYLYTRYMNRDAHVLSNTINLSAWTKGTFNYRYYQYGAYIYYGRGRRENNIINIANKHSASYYYCWYVNGTNSTQRFKHNNLYIQPTLSGTKRYGYWNGARTSFANWTTYYLVNSSATTTNYSADFISVPDFVMVPNNPNLRNAGLYLSDVLDDTYKETRDLTTPDIGAIEFYFDLEISNINIVGNNECSGYEEAIGIVLKNNGNVRLPNVPIDLYENGVYLTTVNSGPIGKSETITVPYNAKWNGDGNFVYKAEISLNDEVAGNNSATNSIDIFASPSGGSLIAGGSSAGMHRAGMPFDVTIIPDGIEYEVTEPTKFANTDYGTGTGWKAEVITTLKDGTPVALADEATWTAPSGSANGVVKFYPTATVIDELLTLKVRVYDEQSGCDTFIVQDVLIAPEGVPDFAFPTINCFGKDVAFDNASSVSTGVLTYEWDFDDGETSTSVHPVHEYAAPGTYDVTLTTTTDPWGYKNTKTIQVEVKPIPTADFTRVNACEGKMVELTNTSSGADTYEWDLGDPSKAKSTATDISTQYAPGGYTVTLTAMKGGCSNTVSKPVYQYAMPVSSFTLTSGKCNTDEFMFDNNSSISDGNVGFTWAFGDGEISTDANPSHMYQNSGNYNVELTAISEFGCEHKSVQQVSVDEGPAVDFTYGNTCSNTATPFTNNTTYPSGMTPTYTWNFGDGSASSSMMNPDHNWAISGELTVTLDVSLDNGCSGSKSETVKVLPEPVADFEMEDVCAGDELTLSNKTTWVEGDINYTWDFDGAILAPTDATSPSGTAANAGTYDVKLTAEVTDGCSHEVTKTLTVSDAPVSCMIIQTPDHGNGLNAYKFAASIDGTNPATESNVEYFWHVEDHGNHQGGSIDIDFQYDGDYVVSLTARNTLTGCECTNSVNHNNVDLEDIQFGESISLYPNPASTKVIISIAGAGQEKVEVEVLNVVGATVIDASQFLTDNGQIEMPLNDLPDGLYLVRIKKGNTVSTKKLNISK